MEKNNNIKVKKIFNILFYVLLISYIVFTGFKTMADDWDRANEIRQLAEEEYEEGRISKEKYDELIKEAKDIENTLKKIEKEEDDYKKENNISIDHREENYHRYQRGEISESEYQETDDELRDEEANWWDIGNLIFDAFVKVFEWILDIGLRMLLSVIVRLLMEIVELFSNELFGIVSTTFYPESQNSILGSMYGTLNGTIMAMSLSLIMLMVLYKGFMTYIMWKDGNPEENPFEIIMRYMFAIAMMFSFNELFAIAANVIGSLSSSFNISSGSVNLTGGLLNIILNFNTGKQILTIFLLIKFLKTLYNAVITIITKGIEIMILRLGFPFACVSAVTPQASGFHSYIMSIAKGMFSIVVMNVFIGLSTKIISGTFSFSNVLWAIAVLEVANNGGSIINSIISSGGGNQTGGEVVGGIQGAGISAGKMAAKVIKGIATHGAGAGG